jgi:hypothetical protein
VPTNTGGAAITGYKIYNAQTGELLKTVGNITATSISGLQNFSIYKFKVTAINEYGLEKFNLKNQSIVDIINGPDFSDFFLEGWKKDTIQNGKLLYCLETCGHKSSIDKLYTTKTITTEVQ